MTFVVEMENIEKSFGTNKVLKGVDFRVRYGSIHALLGENGTGKTTLMNILAKIISKDNGSIKIDKKEQEASIDEVAFIHQELSLVNDLCVYENLFLGREIKKNNGFLDKQKMINKTRELISDLGIQLKAEELVDNLNPALKQITEILRALLQDAKVIIMDEPTTSLTDVEIKHLFEVMKRLKYQGVSLIFISHKLNEVLDICDSYTVMRDGLVVDTAEITENLSESYLSGLMIGKNLEMENFYQSRQLGDVIFEIKNYSKNRFFKNANMILKKGEIIGVTGLLGDGRSELFLSVIGALDKDEGQLFIEGKSVNIKYTSDSLKYGIAYVPKNRKENGVIPDLNILENLTLPIMKENKKFGLINYSTLSNFLHTFKEKLSIKMHNEKDSILSLSGGNQQKVLLARALVSKPKIVILDNPTQGVDVGAKLEIYTLIQQLANQGISFIILSSEFSEIEKICDRTYVMYEGEVRYEFLRNDLNESDVMLVAAGGKINGKEK